jgi:hypothetical protein
MPQYMFGAGSLYGVRNDQAGPYTPRKFAILQDVSFDFTRTIKQLTGSYNLPVALGAGTIKTTAKAKAARVFAGIYADLFFGITPSTGQTLLAEDENHAVPGGSPYTVTIAPPNSGVYVADMGVWYANTGKYLTAVASGPTIGQYSVVPATGVYTFASGDSAASVNISYTYTVTTGSQIAITGSLLGVAPTFMAVFRGSYLTLQTTLKLNLCMSEKFGMATKLEDFTIPEFDFMFAMDATNTLGTLSFSE